MKLLGTVIKSATDKRMYKAVQLPNKLDCLIISDAEAEKSSSSMSVGAGSFQDPIEVQGLAHYLEHMLFMGTDKYPNENEYSEFLAKNSGTSNAYTAQEETNYHLEVASHAFRDALDRFAQFFISPKMSESSSEREMQAVHSEHTKNLQNDSWRNYQLWKSSSKKDSPLNKFSTGDLSTLKVPNVREQLLNFYGRNYSANLMKLVVYGKEDVDSLSEFVEEKFGGILNKDLETYRLPGSPFDESTLGNLYRYVPIKDKQTVEFIWIVSNFKPNYKNSPGKYISHLIGHEGPGSLLSLLIKEGLALELSAGSSDEYDTFTELQISVTLTDKGLDNIWLIGSYLFAYLEMLKKEGPQRWVFEEIKKINKLKFDFADKKQGMSAASQLSKRMQQVPVEQVLFKEYFMEEWHPELIDSYLSQLTRKNLRVIVASQKFESQCTLTEPIYGTKYAVEALPEINPQNCSVHFPPANEFFPEDLTVQPASAKETPTKLSASSFMDLFFKPDHRFQLAKGQVKLRLYYDGDNTAESSVTRDIYEKLLKNYLREMQYMGETASINCKLSFHTFYVDIDLKGFNDSLRKFLPRYLEMILGWTPELTGEFEDIRIKKLREYNNFFLDNPYQQAYQYHLLALRDGAEVDPKAVALAAELVKFDNILQYNRRWKQKLFAELYVAGNFTQAKAEDFAETINKLLRTRQPLDKAHVKTIRAVQLRENEVWVVEKPLLNVDEKNSSLIVHFQYEEFGVTTKLLQDICMMFMKEPAFDYLRTKEQLGYVVMCLPDDHRGILGLSILIQSNVKSPHELSTNIAILKTILKEKLAGLTEQAFEGLKKAAYTSKLQKDKDLDTESTRFWTEITKHTYLFDRKERELEELPRLKLEDFKAFFERVFLTSPKCFETHIICQSHTAPSEQCRDQRVKDAAIKIAPSIEWFKKRMPLYPDLYALL